MIRSITYHDRRNFDVVNFRENIRYQTENREKTTLEDLQNIFTNTYLQDAFLKEKVFRGNNAPF